MSARVAAGAGLAGEWRTEAPARSRPLVALALALSLAARAASAEPAPSHRESSVRTPSEGAPLPEAPVVRSSNGALSTTLVLGPARVEGPYTSLTTRVFNGSLPGPTLAVRPGDKLSILFVNELEAPVGPDATNSYHHPNKTNLHVHGLHVSPQTPSDNVLDINLGPGESFHYEYQLIADHSPGTYWVHPHHHGSAVLQSGAGAAGALLVLDPPGFLSEQLAALRDRVLVLQAFPLAGLQKAAKASKDALFHVDRWKWGQELWLVNGAPVPIVSLRPREWQRLRFVAAGVSTWLHLDFGACDVALLAKDGIYINDFPRFVRRVSLPQGGRADVVVRCPEGAAQEVSSVAAEASKGAKSFLGPVFRLLVEGRPAEGLAAESALRPWAPRTRPKYLQDTRSVAEPDCSCPTSLGLGGNTRWVEGHLWSGPASYMHVSPANAVVERRLAGVAKHPYHAHTYPFQLLNTPAGNDPYFKSGDWHDTYFNAQDAKATVRYRTVDYYGPQVVHCHNPAHSDMGMIAVELVAKGQGAGHCGCGLLALEKEAGGGDLAAAAGRDFGGANGGEALNSVAASAFLVMLALAVGLSAQLVRACRHAGEPEQRYLSLAKGPADVQESA